MKNKYFSNRINVILFSFMMLVLSALLGCFIYLFIDVMVQAKSGTDYVFNQDLGTAFVIIATICLVYGVFYASHLISYFLKKHRKYDEGNIKVKLADGADNKVVDKLQQRFNAEIIENEQNSPVPTCFYVEEEHNHSKKTIFHFIMYLTLPTYLILMGVCVACAAIILVVLFNSLVPLIAVESFFATILIFGTVLMMIVYPNMFYKRITENKMPSSIRIYDDRVEEVNLLATGQEIRYICRYEFANAKEYDHYLFVKGRSEKAIVGILVDKNRLTEDQIAFIKGKIKK